MSTFNFNIPHCPRCNGDIVNNKCQNCRYEGKGEIVKPFTSQAAYEREAYKDRNNGDYDRTYYGDEL
ncbi:hypothetical protein CKO18_07700 [Rhodoferax fermentans]|uniref:Uncharacterized protein n=1 Tax=Rhodoferax fermentans TaxID=28066 RepID=A0A1T1AP57_RHOFE|nr:hypothetical protein [Rhodoferax fermentans]MBK1683462.1 hypothetical protein [Rhodoferax fermentans]OOV05795.1 hypothetical protein RF819_02890 [Rhodoferax fermentans]